MIAFIIHLIQIWCSGCTWSNGCNDYQSIGRSMCLRHVRCMDMCLLRMCALAADSEHRFTWEIPRAVFKFAIFQMWQLSTPDEGIEYELHMKKHQMCTCIYESSHIHISKNMDYKCAMTINRLIHQAMVAWATLTVQTSFWKSEGWFGNSNAHACGCSGCSGGSGCNGRSGGNGCNGRIDWCNSSGGTCDRSISRSIRCEAEAESRCRKSCNDGF